MAAMQLDRYEIVPAGDHWAVRLNATILRTFPQRMDAIRAAIEAAQASLETGIVANVLSQGPGGEVVPLFTFGRKTSTDEA
jgi:hypothetical protein